MLTNTIERAGYTGLIVMAVLGIILWGGIDIRFMFGVIALTVLTIYASIIGKSIYDSYEVVRRYKEQNLETKQKTTLKKKKVSTKTKPKQKAKTTSKGGMKNA